MSKNWVVIGSIGKTHGFKGWIKIQSYTEPANNILDYQPWSVKLASTYTPLKIEAYHFHGNQLLVRFAGYATPESVRILSQLALYIPREQLPQLAENEYYWADLEGLKVYTRDHVYLGQVKSLFATGSNDVVIVEGEKRYLIPYLLHQTILSIDLKQKLMIVDWEADF